jgi:hypothetical protein
MAMDLIRVCYTTRMRLWRDSDEETEVRWFRADEGAQWWPGPHRFCSHVWFTDRRAETSLGERPGFGGRQRGVNELGYLGLNHCGPAAAAERGGDRGLDPAIVTDADGACPDCLRADMLGTGGVALDGGGIPPAVVAGLVTQLAGEVLRGGAPAGLLTQLAAEVLVLQGPGLVTQLAGEALRGGAPAGLLTQLAGEALRGGAPAGLLTQLAGEALRGGAPAARVTQVVAEAVHTPNQARLSQVVADVLRGGAAAARLSQAVADVLRGGAAAARLGQAVADVLRGGAADARLSQVVAEVVRR